MAKVQAVHTIQRAKTEGKRATRDTPAVAPEIETIKAGTIFESSGEELESLRKAGSVKEPDERPASLERVEGDEGDDGDNSPRGRRARTAASTKAKPATAGAAAKAKEEGKKDGTEKDGNGEAGGGEGGGDGDGKELV